MSDPLALYKGLAAYVPPRMNREGPDLDHMFSTAYQFGCMALEGMGLATETRSGCRLSMDEAQFDDAIEVFPKELLFPTEDAAVVLLSLARQIGDATFIDPAPKHVREDQFVIRQFEGPQQPLDPEAEDWLPEMRRAYALGQALQRKAADKARRQVVVTASWDDQLKSILQPEVAGPLEAAGYISNGGWTEAARPMLWRKGAWREAFDQHPAFSEGLRDCLETLPNDVALLVETSVRQPTDIELRKAASQVLVQHLEHWERLPEKIREMQRKPTLEETMQRLGVRWSEFKSSELNNMFFARWRLDLGWDPKVPLLPLFHDPLAIAMRKAVQEALR